MGFDFMGILSRLSTCSVSSKRDFMRVGCASGFSLGFGFHQEHGDGAYTVWLGEPFHELSWTRRHSGFIVGYLIEPCI